MKKYLVIFLVLLATLNLSAQVKIDKSNVVKEINGVKYYIHTVKAGHTLYSICKAYDVSQIDIHKANKNFSTNISVGQKINIPVLFAGQDGEPVFYWHKVVEHQTLYSISKKYKVSIEDIIQHNPNAKYGLVLGQILKIPNIKKGSFDFQDSNYLYYTVEQGNTLFSISQKYGVDINQIKLLNPSCKSGLKVGMQLKIPKVNYTVSERLPIFHEYLPNSTDLVYDPNYFEQLGVTPCNSFAYNKATSFNVVLMLPLYLQKNSTLGLVSKDGKSLLYKNSEIFLEMYQGMLIALHQLKTQGISVKLTVYDTENSTAKVKEILKKPALKSADLIIGPVYSHNVAIAAGFARKHKINLISPLSQNSSILKNNPFLFQVMPSKEMRVKKTSDFLSKLYDTSIVFIHNGTSEEQKLINIYKQKLVKSYATHPDLNYLTIKNLDYNLGGKENLEGVLSLGLKNVVILPTNDEVFVTTIIDKLYLLSDKYEIQLWGVPTWDNFKSTNISHLHNLSFHYVSPVYLNYENWRIKSFIKKYRQAYNTEPAIYSYEGYDIMYYFVGALKQYGKHFQFCLSPYDKYPNKSGIVFDFNFIRTGTHNGFENNGTHILEYSKYFKLIKSTY